MSGLIRIWMQLLSEYKYKHCLHCFDVYCLSTSVYTWNKNCQKHICMHIYDYLWEIIYLSSESEENSGFIGILHNWSAQFKSNLQFLHIVTSYNIISRKVENSFHKQVRLGVHGSLKITRKPSYQKIGIQLFF